MSDETYPIEGELREVLAENIGREIRVELRGRPPASGAVLGVHPGFVRLRTATGWTQFRWAQIKSAAWLLGVRHDP